MTTSTMLVLILVSLVLLTLAVFIHSHIKEQRKTIERQHETILRLINREPVTYKEVNTEPPKPDTDRPIAWGGQIRDRDDL